MRKLQSVEEKGLLMQYHSMNIKKTAEAIKKIKFQILHTKLDGALELISK